ncbi:MAG: CocE/NonD family hydrolase [bacterium]|nr:MAG: CocE/NonD family hydrolase [bacterium]
MPLSIYRSCIFLLLVLTSPGATQDSPGNPAAHYIIENYNKQEYRIPMRDGIKLHTRVYTPNDKSTTYPILFTRTPYYGFYAGEEVHGHFGYPGPGPTFPTEGYIFVIQDVRGRFLSEGTFQVMRPNTAAHDDPGQTDESTDAFDSIEWLLKNVENNNGRVGVHGLSWGGYYAALSLVNAHPSIVAAAIEAPVAEGFLGDDYHHNGALHLLFPFRWLNNVGLAEREGPSADIQPPVYQEKVDNYFSFLLELGPLSNLNERCFRNKIRFWNDIMQHGTYDEFWKIRTLGPHLKHIDKPAILVVGSWFDDQDLYGTLHTYRAIEDQNPGVSCSLIMGVWNHASWWRQKKEPWGFVGLPVKETGDHYRNDILSPFFESHLKGDGEFVLPEALVCESGTNEWQEYDCWPPKHAEHKKFFLGGNGSLLNTPPDSDAADYSVYVSDPSNPVPHLPADIIGGWNAAVMHANQRFAAAREDVLVYQGEILKEAMTLVGPVEVDLHVSTTGTDADWVVKVIDVYPDDAGNLAGYQMLVRGDIMRGKFRNSFEEPIPFVPGEVTRVTFTLPDVNHTFRKGHRIMVQVQSSWFPMFDRNPQTFVDIYHATEADFQTATHTVYHSQAFPSHIAVKVLPK